MSVLDEPLVFVDIETNGLDHIRGRVVEVAAIRVEHGEIVDGVNTLVDPESPLPQFITGLTGITDGDLRGAPTFAQIADELYALLDGAIFVAHNVRFDYSFLKQEFKRLRRPFLPRQLCTVKLSRALYPQYRSHKLQDLIDRHGFSFVSRHRAYDDAHVLWQFIQHTRQTFDEAVLTEAVARQLKQPALPKAIDPAVIAALPTGPGVYIFEDEKGDPLYVGKSINIKKRVLSHFGHDHDERKEFKLSQGVHSITTRETAGELEALLLESQLVKELQPLHNRQLRRLEKLLLARRVDDAAGYITVNLQEAKPAELEPDGSILAVYPRRGAARESLERLQKTFDLCPKLLGLEKTKGACFLCQLHKCRGACVGKESAEQYNQRLLLAFEHHRIQDWPFSGPVLVNELTLDGHQQGGIVVDQWRVLARVAQEEFCEPTVERLSATFDLDAYKILHSFIVGKVRPVRVMPLSVGQLAELGLGA